jgi:hypothetical protein
MKHPFLIAAVAFVLALTIAGETYAGSAAAVLKQQQTRLANSRAQQALLARQRQQQLQNQRGIALANQYMETVQEQRKAKFVKQGVYFGKSQQQLLVERIRDAKAQQPAGMSNTAMAVQVINTGRANPEAQTNDTVQRALPQVASISVEDQRRLLDEMAQRPMETTIRETATRPTAPVVPQTVQPQVLGGSNNTLGGSIGNSMARVQFADDVAQTIAHDTVQ